MTALHQRDHYRMQRKRAEQLQTFAEHSLGNMVRYTAWHILRRECGGVWATCEWLAALALADVRVRLRMWFRLSVLRLDPEDDKTWD